MTNAEDLMTIETYLLFHGDCREAFDFYQSVLGGTIETMMCYGEAPGDPHVPGEWKDKIMHARLAVNGQALMGSDAPPGRQEAPGSFNVSVSIETIEEAERIYAGLSAGAQRITMPLGETFWAKRFGMFTDRFGIPWMVNGEGA